MQRSTRFLALVLTLSLLLSSWPVIGFAQPVADEPVIEPDFGATSIAWNVPQGSAGFILVVSGPDDYRFEQSFQSGAPLAFQTVDASGAPLADGLYKYELTPVRYDLTKARSTGDDGRSQSESRELAQSQANSRVNLSAVSGAFTIQNGAILDPDAVEEQTQAAAQPQQVDSPTGIDAPADVVHADDVIIQGSACVGFDCVNNENFGFDTIRLKENNTRIKFEDTSSTGSFPTTDWQLTANDSASGGQNKFSIEDITAARNPFTIEGSSPTNSLYVDSTGRIGFRTSTPVLDLHVATGNTPGLRLEQNGTSGFTSQSWDIAGNESNFFVRDVTNGSKLPFRIQPNTPESTIRMFTGEIAINDGGNSYDTRIEGDTEPNLLFVDGSADKIGIGTNAPTASLHVKRDDGTAQILVEEASGTATNRNLFYGKNNGGSLIALEDTRVANILRVGNINGNLFFLSDNFAAVKVESNGNMTLNGNLTVNGTCTGCRTSVSSSLSSSIILSKTASIPVIQWDSTANKVWGIEATDNLDEVNVTHISPDMQAFYSAYGLGLDGDQISPLDVATIALASVKALKETVDAQDAQINVLEAQLAAMEERLQRLEQMSHTHSYLPNVTSN